MSIAAKRIEKYLAARKKMRQLDQACIHWINEAELRTEDVSALLEQRAELLEALKNVMGYVEEGWIPDGESMFHAREAITKAEAAE